MSAPFYTKMRGATLIEKVEAYSVAVPFSGCWIWMRSLGPTGYGQLWNGSFMEGAHRCSWKAFKGPIPAELDVLHHCDVRCCVNPSHLYLGTHQQNMDDMMNRGRNVPLPGESNGFVKITDAQVASIVAAYATGKYTQKAIAKKFSCSQQLVSRITRLEHRANGELAF